MALVFDTSVFIAFKPTIDIHSPSYLISAVVIQELMAGARDGSELKYWEAIARVFWKQERLLTPTFEDWFMAGKILSKPQPAYPPIARAARAQGAVTVQIVVGEEGKVMAAQAISGHPLLQAAAVKAAREARFSPFLLDGKPVKVSGVITYTETST